MLLLPPVGALRPRHLAVVAHSCRYSNKQALPLPQEPRYRVPRGIEDPTYSVPGHVEPRSLLVALPGEQSTAPDARSVDIDLDLAEPLAGLGRGGQLFVRCPTLDFGVWVYGRAHVFFGDELHGFSPAVRQRRLLVHLALFYERLAVVAGEAVLEQGLRLCKTCHILCAEYDRYVGLVTVLGGGDEVGSRLGGGPGLYAGRLPVGSEEQVGVGDLYRPVLGADRGVRGVYNLGKHGVLERFLCYLGEIPGARVVVGGVQTGGGLEVSVLQPHFVSFFVHPLDEIIYAPCGETLG